MKLIPIPEHTEETLNQYNEVFNKVQTLSKRHVIKSYTRTPGYAHVYYRGELREDVTELELAMLLDNGYSWFGGTSSIYNDKSFIVKIFTD